MPLVLLGATLALGARAEPSRGTRARVVSRTGVQMPDTDSARTLYSEGVSLYGRGDYAGAILVWDRCAAMEDAGAWGSRAAEHSLHAKEVIRVAAGESGPPISIEPSDPVVRERYSHGVLLYSKGSYMRAIQVWGEVVQHPESGDLGRRAAEHIKRAERILAFPEIPEALQPAVVTGSGAFALSGGLESPGFEPPPAARNAGRTATSQVRYTGSEKSTETSLIRSYQLQVRCWDGSMISDTIDVTTERLFDEPRSSEELEVIARESVATGIRAKLREMRDRCPTNCSLRWKDLRMVAYPPGQEMATFYDVEFVLSTLEPPKEVARWSAWIRCRGGHTHYGFEGSRLLGIDATGSSDELSAFCASLTGFDFAQPQTV